jgi:hypothetical protein
MVRFWTQTGRHGFGVLAGILARLVFPSKHFLTKPLLLGLVLFGFSLPVVLGLHAIIWATGVGASAAPPADADPVSGFLLTTLVAPMAETAAMVLLYELLHALLRQNALVPGLVIAALGGLAHGSRGLLAISAALAFGLFAYEYVVYRRVFGAAGGSVAVFVTHATNNTVGATIVFALTRWGSS